MASLTLNINTFILKRPISMIESEKPYWTKPTGILLPLDLKNQKVEYKYTYIQRKSVYGFEILEANHTIVLFINHNKEEKIQFEDEENYKKAVEELERFATYL